MASTRHRAHRSALAATASAVLILTGCSALAGLSGIGSGVDVPRDAEGRPMAPPPPTPTTCITVTIGSTAPTCAPIHNPPTRRFVEQAIPTLLPTRGYGSIGEVRCSERIPPPPRDSGIPDPDGLGAATEFSHWTCVGREPEGDYLHQDVLWTPYSGYLTLNAVTHDRSPALTMPRPNDPGLPNPHASEEPEPTSPAAAARSAGVR